MICFNVGKERFNFRVSGIFLDGKGERFLTNTTNDIDFCVLPGGRVEMGEDTTESLKRELMEELGVEIDIKGLKCTTENFFEFDGYKFHELQYVYVAQIKDNVLDYHKGPFMGEENKDIYVWYNIKDLEAVPYKPAHLKEIIKEVASGDLTLRHMIHKGNE